jgi:sugar phosphate isomerase/epimerase
MHIGCSTICYGNGPADLALRSLREAGFTNIDLAAIRYIAPHADVWGRPQGQAEQLARAAAANKLVVDALICVPWYADALDDWAELERRYRCLVEVASAVGAPTHIVDANTLQEHEERRYALDRFKGATDLLAGLASAQGIGVAVEVPHAYTLAETLEQSLEVLEYADNPSLGVDYDTSHIHNSGATIEESLAALGDRIVHVALRDVLGPDRYGAPGDGLFDFDALLGALDRIGYTGPLTLELEPRDDVPIYDRVRDAIRGREYISALLATRPAGRGPMH